MLVSLSVPYDSSITVQLYFLFIRVRALRFPSPVKDNPRYPLAANLRTCLSLLELDRMTYASQSAAGRSVYAA